jgi:rhodanese-related sulfurtransferase
MKLIIFVLCFFFTISSFATEYLPLAIKGAKTISVEKAYEFFLNHKAIFIDTRPILEYSEGHIPSALHMFFNKNHPSQFSCSKINDLDSEQIVVYCNGPECRQSFGAVKQLVICSVNKKIYWYRGGMKSWFFKELPINQGVQP